MDRSATLNLAGQASSMRTIEELQLIPVWVNPGHLVASAILLMQGHNLRALGVLEGEQLRGIVTLERLRGAAADARIEELMEPGDDPLDGSMPVRKVADLFVQSGLEFAPIFTRGRFSGLLTSTMLLRELGRSWDPMTNLSWSDALREWGVEKLQSGQEVTLLFCDLNDFGQYNKAHGHIVGDRVLRAVGDTLRSLVDFGTDVLVRYGGDEFAIGTVRDRSEVAFMAQRIKEQVRAIPIDDNIKPVSVCIGISGGKRTRERESVHFAATLDSLINLASRDCIAQKEREKAAVNIESPSIAKRTLGSATLPKEMPSVVFVRTDEGSPNSLTSVVLNTGSGVRTGVDLRAGKPLLESIARATAKALERIYVGWQFEVEKVLLLDPTAGEPQVSVSGSADMGGGPKEVSATLAVEGDVHRSLARATIEAFLSASNNHVPLLHAP